MITLAFDGTAKVASVAVLDGERALGYTCIDNGLTQSELLLPMAEDLLSSLKMKFSDVELYATSVGPGSFTGVRIGVSLIKGLAFAKNAPCVPISTLEALAMNLSPIEGIIAPCMDARRAQVYNAIFESDGTDIVRITPDRAIALSSLAEELQSYKGKKIYLCGDGYEVAKTALTNEGIATQITPPLLINENAVSVGILAQKKYALGEYVSDAELSPTYLRLPQAERERLERLALK